MEEPRHGTTYTSQHIGAHSVRFDLYLSLGPSPCGVSSYRAGRFAHYFVGDTVLLFRGGLEEQAGNIPECYA